FARRRRCANALPAPVKVSPTGQEMVEEVVPGRDLAEHLPNASVRLVNRHRQSMILLIAYSTMPRPPAARSSGIIVRTSDSSTIVLRATQSGSERDETVGVCNAGSFDNTFGRSLRCTFIMMPTFPSAARHDRSMSAMLSSLVLVHGSR